MYILFGDKESKNSNQRYEGRMQTHIHCGLIHGRFQWLRSWGIPCSTSIYNMPLFVSHSHLGLLTLQKLLLCFYSHTMLICYCKCTCGNELLKEQGRWTTHLPPANSPLSLFSCCRISKNISKGKVIHPKISDIWRGQLSKKWRGISKQRKASGVACLQSLLWPFSPCWCYYFCMHFLKERVFKYMLGL